MPSPIGHALAGVAVAWTFQDRHQAVSDTTRGQTGTEGLTPLNLTTICALLAALPDIDLVHPAWHRAVTHSIGCVLLVTIITAAVTGWVNRKGVQGSRLQGSKVQGPWRVVLVCGAAYASHLLLDWLAADYFPPYGIRALWPFDDGWYISGVEVFRQTARQHLFTLPILVQNAEAIAQEIAILGPIVYLLWLVRVKPAARLAPEISRRNHPAE